MGINYGRLRMGVAARGFPQVSSKTTVKSRSDVCVCACGYVVGTPPAKGGRLSSAHTWVCLVPDDSEWNDPVNIE